MLDIKFIRENKTLIEDNCRKRRVEVDIDRLLVVDNQRKDNLKKIEELRALRNRTSKGKPTNEEIIQMRTVGEEIKELENRQNDLDNEWRQLLFAVPNLTHPETPIGGEHDFKVLYQNFPPPIFNFSPSDHESLMVKNDLIDWERGAKVTGAKFYFSKNTAVRLNLALLNYGIEIVTKHGYELLETPDLAKDSILTGIGFNPRGPETQTYSIEGTDLSLIGTAEITVGGYHADEVLNLENGPKKYVALSHCFRTESGSYGRTSKGLYRVHQFAKLEMFIFCKPEESEKNHQEILKIEQEIMDGLGLPYRVIDIASGDLGGPAFRKFDIEAWMTMKAADTTTAGDYGEVTSASNCLDYQARRLNIRYRQPDGTLNFVHTLNGTAIVLSRFPIAIIENYQQADGTIKVPEVLQKYLGTNLL